MPRVYSWYKSTRAGLMSGLFILNVLSACFCLHWITTVQISFYMPLSDHEERKRRKKKVLVKILSVSSGWDVVKNVFILPSFIGLQLHFHKFLFSVFMAQISFFSGSIFSMLSTKVDMMWRNERLKMLAWCKCLGRYVIWIICWWKFVRFRSKAASLSQSMFYFHALPKEQLDLIPKNVYLYTF